MSDHRTRSTPPALTKPTAAHIPTRWVGPLRVSGNVATTEIEVPLATYESPLWPAVGRGAQVSRMVESGITATLVDERMTRSVLVEADTAEIAHAAARAVHGRIDELRAITRDTSRFAELLTVRDEIVGSLLFLRFEFSTGDASGHNMTTLAADALLSHLLKYVPGIRYGSISANYCTDKKATAINGILGRGKNVITEILIPERIVTGRLHTTAVQVAKLNTNKNLVGTLLAAASAPPTPTTRTCFSPSTSPLAKTPPTSWKAPRASLSPKTAAATSTSPAPCPTSLSAPSATAKVSTSSRNHSPPSAAARSAPQGTTHAASPSWPRPPCSAANCRCSPPRPIQANS